MKYTTDTDRLNFLLKHITIDDIGDEEYIPGVVINYEALEEALTWNRAKCPRINICALERQRSKNVDVRRLIDQAIYRSSS